MTDIFISYASQDRDRIQPIVEALKERGWSVWWDRTLHVGADWEREIEAALTASRCVIVIWSEASVQSDWVWTEADEAKKRGVLVPVMLDRVAIPMAFRKIHAASLVSWQCTNPSLEFDELAGAVTALLTNGNFRVPESENAGTLSKVFSGRKHRSMALGSLAWQPILTVTVLAIALIVGTWLYFAFGAQRAVAVKREQMPCRWAWIYLGRYSKSKVRYELPEGFKYADNSMLRGPIPSVGDSTH